MFQTNALVLVIIKGSIIATRKRPLDLTDSRNGRRRGAV